MRLLEDVFEILFYRIEALCLVQPYAAFIIRIIGAEIHVHRADQGADIIAQAYFAMNESWCVFIDLHAFFTRYSQLLLVTA